MVQSFCKRRLLLMSQVPPGPRRDRTDPWREGSRKRRPERTITTAKKPKFTSTKSPPGGFFLPRAEDVMITFRHFPPKHYALSIKVFRFSGIFFTKIFLIKIPCPKRKSYGAQKVGVILYKNILLYLYTMYTFLDIVAKKKNNFCEISR